jgi:hypothetical protein
MARRPARRLRREPPDAGGLVGGGRPHGPEQPARAKPPSARAVRPGSPGGRAHAGGAPPGPPITQPLLRHLRPTLQRAHTAAGRHDAPRTPTWSRRSPNGRRGIRPRPVGKQGAVTSPASPATTPVPPGPLVSVHRVYPLLYENLPHGWLCLGDLDPSSPASRCGLPSPSPAPPRRPRSAVPHVAVRQLDPAGGYPLPPLRSRRPPSRHPTGPWCGRRGCCGDGNAEVLTRGAARLLPLEDLPDPVRDWVRLLLDGLRLSH